MLHVVVVALLGGRGRRVHDFAQNLSYDPLYTHPGDIPEQMPWEDTISLLTVDGMREHSTRFRNELKSCNLSAPS